jgi:hypothetical protein
MGTRWPWRISRDDQQTIGLEPHGAFQGEGRALRAIRGDLAGGAARCRFKSVHIEIVCSIVNWHARSFNPRSGTASGVVRFSSPSETLWRSLSRIILQIVFTIVSGRQTKPRGCIVEIAAVEIDFGATKKRAIDRVGGDPRPRNS